LPIVLRKMVHHIYAYIIQGRILTERYAYDLITLNEKVSFVEGMGIYSRKFFVSKYFDAALLINTCANITETLCIFRLAIRTA
jgi:hypothetical protein